MNDIYGGSGPQDNWNDDIYPEVAPLFNPNIKVSTRTSKFTELTGFCMHSGPNSFVEICEWANGEGVDVHMSTKLGEQSFQMTWGEYDCLVALMEHGNES